VKGGRRGASTMAPLPLFKLFYIASKQIAKPISKQINRLCANSEFTRNWVVVPLGQRFNLGWIRLQRIADGSARKRVRSLPEQDAVQLGGEIIAETFLFTVAAVFVIEEYRQKDVKEGAKKEAMKATLAQLGGSIDELSDQIQTLNAQVETLKNEAQERSRMLEQTADTNLASTSTYSSYDSIPGVRLAANTLVGSVSTTQAWVYTACDLVEEYTRTPVMLLGNGISSLLGGDE